MLRYAFATLMAAILFGACSEGKYDSLPLAPDADRNLAAQMWSTYLQDLGKADTDANPIRVARYFSAPLLARTSLKEFGKNIRKARSRQKTGILTKVKVVALRTHPDGPMLIVDSPAGETALPLRREHETYRFAEWRIATGDFTAEPKFGPAQMPAEISLLYIKARLANESIPLGPRLRATHLLAQPKYRKEIIKYQRQVQDPLVRLGLGLARVKIDGFDESFIKNFPSQAENLSRLAKADPQIFEEMLAKLSNLGAKVEDPPANETMFRVAKGAPEEMKARMGKALYDMAEMSPPRFANAVMHLGADALQDPAVKIYLEEAKRRGGKAPKLEKFLRKFSRIGEPEEKSICRKLHTALKKNRS